MKVRKIRRTPAVAHQCTAEKVEEVRIWCGGQHLIKLSPGVQEPLEQSQAGFRLADRNIGTLKVVHIGDWVILEHDEFYKCTEKDFPTIWEKCEEDKQ